MDLRIFFFFFLAINWGRSSATVSKSQWLRVTSLTVLTWVWLEFDFQFYFRKGIIFVSLFFFCSIKGFL